MAYDEHLAQRIRDTAESAMDERKMFGGIAFLLNGNMAVGVNGDEMMVRVHKEETDSLVLLDDVRCFEMGKKSMAGWVLVGGNAIAEEEGLAHWFDIGMTYAGTLPAE